jgi:hypothetical protein
LVSEESVKRKITDKIEYSFLQHRFEFLSFSSGAGELIILHHRRHAGADPVFLHGYGAQISIPRNEFRQPM